MAAPLAIWVVRIIAAGVIAWSVWNQTGEPSNE